MANNKRPIYDIGDRPTFRVAFTDTDGDPVTPTSYSFKTRIPAGTETTYTAPNAAITEVATGIVDFRWPSAFTAAGTYHLRVVCTAGVVCAWEMEFSVRPSAFSSP